MDLSSSLPANAPEASTNTPATRAKIRRQWTAMRPAVMPVLIERDGAVCRYCGATDDLTGEHLLPIASGGTNDMANLGVSCRGCNENKHVWTDEEYKGILRGEGPRMVTRSPELQAGIDAFLADMAAGR